MTITKEPIITVYKSIGGWKAQLMTWNEEYQMHMPYSTGDGYRSIDEAIADGKAWAEAEEVQFTHKEK